jgi:hypothetical protein
MVNARETHRVGIVSFDLLAQAKATCHSNKNHTHIKSCKDHEKHSNNQLVHEIKLTETMWKNLRINDEENRKKEIIPFSMQLNNSENNKIKLTNAFFDGTKMVYGEEKIFRSLQH